MFRFSVHLKSVRHRLVIAKSLKIQPKSLKIMKAEFSMKQGSAVTTQCNCNRINNDKDKINYTVHSVQNKDKHKNVINKKE